MDVNVFDKSSSTFTPDKSQWVILALLFVWSLAQPLAVIYSLPIEFRYKLFFWKNVMGVVVIGYGLTIILINLSQHRYPAFNGKLFLIGLLFPVHSLFNMLFRGYGTSIEEQLLYFLWFLALFVIFPAFFPTETHRRRGMIVLWLANIAALLYAIFMGAGNENVNNWLDYRYRVSFDFVQPNIYSATWSIVFGISVYFYLTSKNGRWRKAMLFFCCAALIFIFLARSESVLLFCLGILGTLIITNRILDRRLTFAFTNIVLVPMLLFVFVNFLSDKESLDAATSSRITVWERAWDYNFGEAGILDYVIGKSSLISGNLKYTGERGGFQAARAQKDNIYLAMFIQNGLIGFVLFFLPLLLLLIGLVHKMRNETDPMRSADRWLLGVWVGVFMQMLGADVIPSFGNVTNIFLLTVTAPALVKIFQPSAVAEIQDKMMVYSRQKPLFHKST